ncbi:MAG: DUF3592 domain-containing protein [Myxococcales bacterium]|jgi:hypothetical protein|nr:DUF3592 domain-containing protein [Myxococcales bacterium]
MTPSRIDPIKAQEIARELHAPSCYLPGALLGLIIALGLGGFGAGLGLLGLEKLMLWHSAQNWAPSSATITSVWTQKRTSKRGIVTGHRLHAKYSWKEPGCTKEICRFYRGEALAIGSDSIFHRGESTSNWLLYGQLKSASTSGRPWWPIFVNPDDPTQAVLDRSMPGRSIFLNVLVGSFLLAGGIFLGLRAFFWKAAKARRARLVHHFPNEPWMHDEGWLTGQLRNTTGHRRLYGLLTGIPFVILPAPAVFHDLVHASAIVQNEVGLVGWLPPVGLAIMAVGFILHQRCKRFGNVWLELFERPLNPGDTLRGWIHLPPMSSSAPFSVHLNLRCEETWTTGTGKYRKNHSLKLHDATSELELSGVDIQGFAVEFDIPKDAPGTLLPGDTDSSWKDNHQLSWTLKAYAAIEGPDLDLSFLLPIFSSGVTPERPGLSESWREQEGADVPEMDPARSLPESWTSDDGDPNPDPDGERLRRY